MLIRFLVPLLLWSAASLGYAAEEPLEPEKAYVFSARSLDAKTLEARWQIADGYYMYRDKIRIAAEPATVKLGTPQMPAGKIKDDEFFGKVETYRGDIRIVIPVDSGGAAQLTLKAVSQGCWDQGVCYPPLTQQATLKLNAAAAPTAVKALPGLARPSAPEMSSAPNLPPAVGIAGSGAPVGNTMGNAADNVGNNAGGANDGDESSRIARLLKHGSFWLVLASFFGFGLLLSLTPCVFPMVPILSGIIVNHGHAVTHLRAFVLSAAYVLGMALTYAAVGVAAGFSGTLLSNALQNAWVLSAFALIFVVLSFSMFGFYELQLPTALQSRLSESANRQGGSLPAIALMGALSALIVGPCVAAPLAGALLYIAQTKDAALGGAALFAMALGMGVPLLVVGVFSRSFLPKAGPWMEAVKKFFGVVMLATALWMVSPVIPLWLQMFCWAALMILPAIYLHALDPLPAHASGWHKLWKGIGVFLLLGGAAMLVGMLGGSRDPLQPLGFLKSAAAPAAAATPAHAPQFERLLSLAELDEQLKTSKQPVILDFYADWCVSCKEMEKLTFADPQVAAQMHNFRLLQADVTAGSDEDKALLKRFSLFGPPGIIFFDRNGREQQNLRVVGYMAAEQFLALLKSAQGARS